MSDRNWEQEWLTGDEPGELIDLAVQREYSRVREYSERKFRLYSCACCRHIWHLLTFANSREVAELAERGADGLESPESLEVAHDQLYEAWTQIPRVEGERRADLAGAGVVCRASWSDARGGHGKMQGAGYVAAEVWDALYLEASGAQLGQDAINELWERTDRAMCDLLRDILGNPFRPVTFAPDWRTSAVTALASQMYDSRGFGNMPVLADALEDAGCDNADVLDHCRGPGPHVRGCWVVDLVLGKE